MTFVGKVTIVADPKHTRNCWGLPSDIAGLTLPVLERNDNGDCLSFWDPKGLVDVDTRDVSFYAPMVDPIQMFINMLKDLGGK